MKIALERFESSLRFRVKVVVDCSNDSSSICGALRHILHWRGDLLKFGEVTTIPLKVKN